MISRNAAFVFELNAAVLVQESRPPTLLLIFIRVLAVLLTRLPRANTIPSTSDVALPFLHCARLLARCTVMHAIGRAHVILLTLLLVVLFRNRAILASIPALLHDGGILIRTTTHPIPLALTIHLVVQPTPSSRDLINAASFRLRERGLTGEGDALLRLRRWPLDPGRVAFGARARGQKSRRSVRGGTEGDAARIAFGGGFRGRRMLEDLPVEVAARHRDGGVAQCFVCPL